MYTFSVAVDRGRGIPTPKLFHERNPYLRVTVKSSGKTVKTESDERSLYPVWREKLVLRVNEDDSVRFEVMDDHGAMQTSPFAYLVLTTESLLANVKKKKWFKFKNYKRRSRHIEVLMTIHLQTAPAVQKSIFNVVFQHNPYDTPLYPPPIM